MPRKLSDDELVELALARFHPLIHDPVAGVASYAELKRQFRDLDEPALSRGIKEAFHRRLVELRKAEGLKPAERSPDLERDLRRTFGSTDAPESLKTVTVLRYAPDAQLDPDDVARSLGWTFGEWLMGSRVVSSGSLIGIGTGQTVYRVSEYVHDRGAGPEHAIPATDVTLVSLTGRLDARARTRRNALADADINAVRMGMGIAGQVDYKLMGVPAVLPENKGERETILRRTWLRSAPPPPKESEPSPKESEPSLKESEPSLKESEPSPKESEPSPKESEPSPARLHYALVGFGPFEQIRKDLVALSKERDRLRGDLDALQRLEHELSEIRVPKGLPKFTPIGDVGGLLLAVDPPAGVELTERQQNLLYDLTSSLKAVNERILTVDQRTLRETELWLVGGGAAKAHILRTVLKSYRVDTLVTDSACAEAALRAESE